MKQKDEILYIVMPAYNEEENIEDTLNEWYPIIAKHSAHGKSRLVVVDDGSKENIRNHEKIREDAPSIYSASQGKWWSRCSSLLFV